MGEFLRKLSPRAVSLTGFYRDLLTRQAHGLTGHIGEYFPDLSDSSSWLGGNGESWERGPYYMDGLVPLSYLLDDPELKTKAQKWIDAVLASQRDDGFFGPSANDDWWPRFVVTKAMATYYEATFDGKALLFLVKFFDYLSNNLYDRPLFFWAYARGMECLEALQIVYEATNDKKYLDLGARLAKQTLDWDDYFANFKYKKKTTHYLSRCLYRAVQPFIMAADAKAKKHPETIKPKTKKDILEGNRAKINLDYLKTHGVNIAMALKYPVYKQYCFSQPMSSLPVWEGLGQVLASHGNVLDLFSSDEHLNGHSPKQGVELCTIVEAMYSMGEILRLTADPKAADMLEYYAYNGLLATITDDFTAHQYVQQVNQIDAKAKFHNHYYDAGRDAATFGIAPYFGCCAANMHQGFPKMAASAILTGASSIYVFLFIPGRYDVTFADGHVIIEVKTTYPFSDEAEITVISSTVTQSKKLYVRLPYAEKTRICVDGEDSYADDVPLYDFGMVREGEKISLSFRPSWRTIVNSDETISLRRGSLLFAYDIPSKEHYLKGTRPFHDRAYLHVGRFRMPHPHTIVRKFVIVDIKRETNGDNLRDYRFNVGVMAEQKPSSLFPLPHPDKEPGGKKIMLVPYGLTRLRIAQFQDK